MRLSVLIIDRVASMLMTATRAKYEVSLVNIFLRILSELYYSFILITLEKISPIFFISLEINNSNFIRVYHRNYIIE